MHSSLALAAVWLLLLDRLRPYLLSARRPGHRHASPVYFGDQPGLKIITYPNQLSTASKLIFWPSISETITGWVDPSSWVIQEAGVTSTFLRFRSSQPGIFKISKRQSDLRGLLEKASGTRVSGQ